MFILPKINTRASTNSIPSDLYLNCMQFAYQLALQSACLNEVPVGAVIFHIPTQTIIAYGHNQTITLQQTHAHAEMQAISKACVYLNNYRLMDCVLFTTLEPCLMCAGAIIHARIKYVYYGLPDSKTGVAGYVDAEGKRPNSLFNAFALPCNHHTTIAPYSDIQSNTQSEICISNTTVKYLSVDALAYQQLLQSFFKQRRSNKNR